VNVFLTDSKRLGGKRRGDTPKKGSKSETRFQLRKGTDSSRRGEGEPAGVIEQKSTKKGQKRKRENGEKRTCENRASWLQPEVCTTTRKISHN